MPGSRGAALTHFHYDHAGAAGQLPHAMFLFDGREWAPAVRGRLLEGYRRERSTVR